MTRRTLACVLALVSGSAASAGDLLLPSSPTVREVKRMSADQLEQLFKTGRAAELPVGNAKGHVLLRTDARCPRLRAHMAGLVWKGKNFEPDGEFTNQWIGFRAIGSRARIDASWLDGQPCVVLEYPQGAALFGNTRDELREIAPGLYLGRFYERCPCPKLQGYFVLEIACGCK